MSGGQHFLLVEPFDPDDDTDRFTVEHPPRCATLDMPCHVGHYEDDGITEHFRHGDDPDPFDEYLPAVAVGRHPIEAWSAISSGPWGTEYSGGLRLVDEQQP